MNQLNKDSVSLATSYMAIGVINFDLKMYDFAIKYFRLATDILISKNAQRELPRAYNALGACYVETNLSDSAIYYLDLSIQIAQQLNDTYIIAQSTMNKANIYFDLGDDLVAEKFANDSKQISEEIGYLNGVLISIVALGEIMNKRGKFKQAKLIGDEALQLLDIIEVDLDLQMNIYGMVYQAAKGLNNHKSALAFHELHVIFKDSLFNNENQKLNS